MIQLADKLDIPLPYAVGILEMLWHFTAQYAKHGNIGKFGNRSIANSLHWQGDHNVLIDALTECGWLDVHAEHRLIVHDWFDHCEDSIHTQIARAHEYFADGQAPRIRHMNSDERWALMKIYEEASPDTINPVEPEVPQANSEKTETVLEDVAPPQEECGDAAPIPVATLHIETRSLSHSQAIAKPCLAMPEPSSSPPAKPHHRPKKSDDDEKTKIEVTRAQLVAWRYSPTRLSSRGQKYRPKTLNCGLRKPWFPGKITPTSHKVFFLQSKYELWQGP